MTQQENGVLWKLFLLSMLLQGRRNADTRRTGEYRERVTRQQSSDICFFWYGLFSERFPPLEPSELGCSLHPAEWQPAPIALAKRARKPLNPHTWWSKRFSLSFVYIINALPLNAKVFRCWMFFRVVFLYHFNTTLSSSDHPRRDSWGRGWDSPQERLRGEEHFKWHFFERVLPVFFVCTGYCCRVAVLAATL